MIDNAVTRKRIRVLAWFILLGAVAGAIIGLLVSAADEQTTLRSATIGITNGLALGATIGFGEEFVIPRYGRRLGYFGLNLFRFSIYTLVIVCVLVVVNTVDGTIAEDISLSESAGLYLREETILRDILISMIATVLVITLLQIRLLHNPGDVRRFLSGRYYFPEEEDRVVFFADLEGSTALAEQLGPMSYSLFIRDCFADISEAIQAWGGRVYQHLGDGVVITWPAERGLLMGTCLRCYFEMYWLLEARRAHYESTYDATPRFRAGIHAGTVIATWVGEAKRELAFHGDVLNTTARIQALCKSFDANCIITGNLLDRLEMPKGFYTRDLGEVSIRGRKEPIRLYSITE